MRGLEFEDNLLKHSNITIYISRSIPLVGSVANVYNNLLP
jgi:hypothetical protein